MPGIPTKNKKTPHPTEDSYYQTIKDYQGLWYPSPPLIVYFFYSLVNGGSFIGSQGTWSHDEFLNYA